MAGDNDQSSSTQSTKTKSDESKPADTSIVTQSIAVESQAEKAVEGKTITTASSEIAPPNSKATSTPPIDAAINFGKIETKTEETAIEPTAASISNASKSEETVTKWEKGTICCSFYISALFISYLQAFRTGCKSPEAISHLLGQSRRNGQDPHGPAQIER